MHSVIFRLRDVHSLFRGTSTGSNRFPSVRVKATDKSGSWIDPPTGGPVCPIKVQLRLTSSKRRWGLEVERHRPLNGAGLVYATRSSKGDLEARHQGLLRAEFGQWKRGRCNMALSRKHILAGLAPIQRNGSVLGMIPSKRVTVMAFLAQIVRCAA